MNNPFCLALFNRFDFQLPLEVVESCSHPGSCDDDVEAAIKNPDIYAAIANIDPKDLAAELAEYGAWDADELADHDENMCRILWVACGNIKNELSC